MFIQRIRSKGAHYGLIGECILELLRARRALLHQPFEETAHRLRVPLQSAPPVADSALAVRQVRAAFGSIHRWVPWRLTCLIRAVAAHQILARRGIASNLVLSVTPASGRTVDAHAWLEAAGIVVTGRHEKEKYVPIYTFSNSPSEDESQLLGKRVPSCSL